MIEPAEQIQEQAAQTTGEVAAVPESAGAEAAGAVHAVPAADRILAEIDRQGAAILRLETKVDSMSHKLDEATTAAEAAAETVAAEVVIPEPPPPPEVVREDTPAAVAAKRRHHGRRR